jgi:hypothetical protein
MSVLLWLRRLGCAIFASALTACAFGASAPDSVYSGFFGVSGLSCTVDLVLASCALVDRNAPPTGCSSGSRQNKCDRVPRRTLSSLQVEEFTVPARSEC